MHAESGVKRLTVGTQVVVCEMAEETRGRCSWTTVSHWLMLQLIRAVANNGDGWLVADKSLQGVHAVNRVTEAQLRVLAWILSGGSWIQIVAVPSDANLVRVCGKSTAKLRYEIEKGCESWVVSS